MHGLQLLANKQNLADTRWVDQPLPERDELEADQVLLRVEEFALTANNITYAVAGESAALEKVIKDAKGPARDLVTQMSEAFRAFAAQSWNEALALLTPSMSSHERIGGSRAQRDLLEFMYLGALLRLDRADEASRLLMMRRPMKMDAHPVAGL